jgi:hypothetical protein
VFLYKMVEEVVEVEAAAEVERLQMMNHRMDCNM